MKFNDKLAKMRKANNLSQEQLADALGVTRQSVSKWESGESFPDMAKIIQLCRTLNCTINDILDDDVVSSQMKEVPVEKTVDEHTNSLQKLFNDFLLFVTRSANMISNMSFGQILKMLIELLILSTILFFVGEFLDWALEDFLWNLLGQFGKVYNITDIILSSILKLAEAAFSVFLVLYVYKIRFLDYYVTLTDNNAKTQSVEEPIEENQTPEFLSKKKEKIVIIRDPKHSNSRVIDAFANVIIVILKFFVVLMTIPVIGLLCSAAAGLIICVVRKGYIFKSSILICLALLLLSGVVLIFFYNLLTNRKQLHKINLLLLLVSFVMGGAGCGLLVNNITNLTIKNENTPVETSVKEVVLKELNENDVIYIESYEIDYELAEDSDEIKIEFVYPSNVELSENIENEEFEDGSSRSYFYYLNTNSLFEFNEFLNDLAENTISDSYHIENYLKVKITCNQENKRHFANLGY